jgi:hypothetical protein
MIAPRDSGDVDGMPTITSCWSAWRIALAVLLLGDRERMVAEGNLP